MRTSVNRFAQRYVPTVLVVLFAACSKGDAPRADSAAARANASSAPSSAARLSAATRQLPGELTKPLDSYTGEELYAFVHGLSFTGDTVRERKCKNDPSCVSAPNEKKIKVGVAAVVGQDSLSSGTVPKFGVVYIRATNMGDAEEARYGLKSGKALEYYVVVLPDSSSGMKWRLEQLDTRAGARQHASIGTGPFTGCKHPWTAGARADFATCDKTATRKDSVVSLGLQLLASDTAPMWVTCADGCCVVGSI